MNAYVWTWKLRIEYIAFADTEEQAKDFLRTQYNKSDLESTLFNSPCQVRPMPRGVCVMDAGRTVWLPYEDDIS